jgi:predicted transcriptional regulator
VTLLVQEPPPRTIQIDVAGHGEQAVGLLKALGHQDRLAILEYLSDRLVPAGQIARDLNLPVSTATMHIAVLEKAGLIQTEMRSASRGLQKVCARSYEEIVVWLSRKRAAFHGSVLSMPIGAFSDVRVQPTCGLAAPTGLIGILDDPSSFYEPARISAQLLWFREGFVEYRFPNRVPPGVNLIGVLVSAEVCSEAPAYDANWPSDIGLWINDRHLGDWTSPGDFGDTRGRLTPEWWGGGTMYGLLKEWRVDATGTSIDGERLSTVTIDDLGLHSGEPIRVRIGVRPDAANVGGLNLFGRGFGDYPQDLELRLEFEPEPPSDRPSASTPWLDRHPPEDAALRASSDGL